MSFRFLSGPTVDERAGLPFTALLGRLEPDGPASSFLVSGPPPDDSLPVS